jgi:hypothetical protein
MPHRSSRRGTHEIVFANLEEASRDRARVTAIYEDLWGSLLELTELGLKWELISKDLAELVKRNWFVPRRGWGCWPDQQPIEPVIREGLTRGFELACAHDPPLRIHCSLLAEEDPESRVSVVSRVDGPFVEIEFHVPAGAGTEITPPRTPKPRRLAPDEAYLTTYDPETGVPDTRIVKRR